MMFAKRELDKVFVCLICLGIANGAVTVAPGNTAVVAGNWMAMECRTTNGSTVFRWTFTGPTSTRKEFVFTNGNGGAKLSANYSYGVDIDQSGSGLLYLNATQLDDAGLYTCYSSVNETNVQHSAQLIVFESHPLCETNYTTVDNTTMTDEGGGIRMQCTVNFRGMWAPTVEWKQHTSNNNGEEEDEEHTTVLRWASTVTMLNTSVTSTLISIDRFTKATYFSCRMFFDWHNGSVKVTATNLPNFNYTWKSPKLLPPQTTAEVMYAAPLPVEVAPDTPKTPKPPDGSNDWYIISLILLAALLIFVSLLVGLGARRYMRFRRSRDISQSYNVSTSSTVPLRRLETPTSLEYNIIAMTTPNIYDRIDGADADDDVAAQAMASQNHNHPVLTQCYSGLMAATVSRPSDYDTLDQFEKVDPVNSEPNLTASKAPECSSQQIVEERYTAPVPVRAFAKPTCPGFNDYLEMVGDAEKSTTCTIVQHVYVDVHNDSDEDNYPDGKLKAFPKGNDEYLEPSLLASNICPS